MDMTNIDKNNLFFASYVSGIKGMPLNTTVLLVNNVLDNSIDLIYNLGNSDADSKTIKYSKACLQSLSYNTRVQMQSQSKKAEEHDTKSMLLSAAVFGGNPIMQTVGSKGVNLLFDTLSNNYDKVDYNTYYEIIFKFLINNEEYKLLLNSETNPEEFINLVNTK